VCVVCLNVGKQRWMAVSGRSMWGWSFLDSRYASGVEARSCSISKTHLAQDNYPQLDLQLCQSTDFFIKTMCSPCQIFYKCFMPPIGAVRALLSALSPVQVLYTAYYKDIMTQ
jgi:hypothetical protein